MLGDEAYPLLPWLIKPYNFGPTLTRSEKLFNKKFCSARVTAERAFGILKARWRCLLKRLDNRIENVSVAALHAVSCTIYVKLIEVTFRPG